MICQRSMLFVDAVEMKDGQAMIINSRVYEVHAYLLLKWHHEPLVQGLLLVLVSFPRSAARS